MKASDTVLPPTREIATRLLPRCHCHELQPGNWPSQAGSKWLVAKPEESAPEQPRLIEYECLTCRRRYRLRGPKLFEVLTDGTERAYMREGRYGRWLSCR
jgi:hypothetical protein